MSAGTYFEEQNPEARRVLYTLHKVILQSNDGISTRLNWGIPFYYYQKQWWCYLAYVKKWECVELGLTRGHLLPNHTGILLERGRKTVRSVEFRTMDDFYSREDAIRELLQEALQLNMS